MAKVVDTRPIEQYIQGHVIDSIHLPTDVLQQLLCALPPRHEVLTFIVEGVTEEATCTAVVAKLGFECAKVVRWDHYQLESTPVVAIGSPNRSLHLWEPNSLLKRCIDTVEEGTGPGIVFDLGCGTSRDMVYLALRGWSAIGFDNRIKLLDQAQRLASNHQTHIDSIAVHLKDNFPIRHSSVDLVVMSRFLHRPTLKDMLRLPRVGGYLVVSHFLDGCQHTPVGSPSTVAGYLLHGELKELVGSVEGVTYDVVLDERTVLPDTRPICEFVARRTR